MPLADILHTTLAMPAKIRTKFIRTFSKASSDSGFGSVSGITPPQTPSNSSPPTPSHSRHPSGHLSRSSSRFSIFSDDEESLGQASVYVGANVSDHYDLQQVLGSGAFSKVYLGESKMEEGGMAAIKIIDKQELCQDEDKMFLVDKEIEIMSQLDHPCIVKLYEVYENDKEVRLLVRHFLLDLGSSQI